MRIRIPTLTVVALFVSFAATACHAMDLRHYDLHSLAYLSTDIVIANLSQQDDDAMVATVTETLYGSLHAGEHLDKLTPFLTFFAPMENNMRVILFLDRRPHKYDFLHSDASKSPFAIPPSGVYLIDEYEHVHEYYQRDNPGPYVAQGYRFSIEKSVPSKEQDLALPSLAEVRSWIAAAIRVVEPVRPLLNKVAARKDAHALLHLADLTSRNDQDCDLRMADAVHERVIGQIDSLHDAGLFLKAYALGGDRQSWVYPLNFIESSGTNAEPARVQYLIQTLSNRKQDPAVRIVSLKFLLEVSRFHSSHQSGPQSGPTRSLPIDNEWLISSADKIQTTSKAIFDDDSEDPQLRGLCLGFISLDHPEIVADVKSVYIRTRSSQLRFAIETSFLAVSEALYQSLNPPGGPVTSLITEMPASGCAKKPSTGIGFRMEQTGYTSSTGRQFVMTNLRTGQRSIRDTKRGSEWSSAQESYLEFELRSLSDLPAGDYSLAMETMDGNKVLSTSYALRLTVHDTHNGKELLLSKS